VTPPPRNLRLRRDADIRELFRSGRRLSVPPLTVVYRRTALEHPRYGVQVSRRTAKRAVTRNRIRRRVREAFRGPLAGWEGGLDLMVLAGAEAATLPWDELAARCRRLVEQITHRESQRSHPRSA
jgi:ribonuclease P protein component